MTTDTPQPKPSPKHMTTSNTTIQQILPIWDTAVVDLNRNAGMFKYDHVRLRNCELCHSDHLGEGNVSYYVRYRDVTFGLHDIYNVRNVTVEAVPPQPKTYTTQEVIALFNKLDEQRSCYHTEDAADILPTMTFLRDEGLVSTTEDLAKNYPPPHNPPTQPIRAYHRSSKAWYANDHHRKTQEVMFGLYDKEGGCEAEMEMTWVNIGGLTARLKVYGEAFMTLHKFADVIQSIAIEEEVTTLTEERFCQILDSLGFIDMTKYKEEE